jgi:hypothetical protein
MIARRYYEDHEYNRGPKIPAHELERPPWGLHSDKVYLVTHELRAWKPALDRRPAASGRSLAAWQPCRRVPSATGLARPLSERRARGPCRSRHLALAPGARGRSRSFLPPELCLWRHRRHAGAASAPRNSVRASACREGPRPWQSEQDREQDARTALAVRASAGSPPGPPGFTLPAPFQGKAPGRT